MEEKAIEISKFDHNTIEALVHSQLLVQVDGRVYLDKPLYDHRYKEKIYPLWRNHIVDHLLNICVSCILFKNHIVLEIMI